MAIISEAPINPKYVYVQATEPADKTEGKLWYNTSNEATYSSDGTTYNLLGETPPKALQIYTGADFNSSAGASAEVENNHELASIPSSKLAGLDYLKITILGQSYVYKDEGSGNSIVQVKIQTKYIGDAYADSMAYQIHSSFQGTASVSARGRIYKTDSIVWLHELTANEKTNGIQINLFSKSTNSGVGSSASFSNKKVSVEGVISDI